MAANIPGWTEFKLSLDRVYQSRFLSIRGRLFFDSSDALVPQAINKQEDVYSGSPPGSGAVPASAPGFVSANGGCVASISSGTSAQESAFLDASENGNDVFFLTTEGLVPQDIDSSYDVYDAHVCSSESPCISAPSSPPPCTTAEACRTASPPQPEVFGAPAGATFNGPGNLTPAVVVNKPPTRAQKLTKALRTCRKDRSKKKRAECERQAKKKYGVAKEVMRRRNQSMAGSK